MKSKRRRRPEARVRNASSIAKASSRLLSDSALGLASIYVACGTSESSSCTHRSISPNYDFFVVLHEDCAFLHIIGHATATYDVLLCCKRGLARDLLEANCRRTTQALREPLCALNAYRGQLQNHRNPNSGWRRAHAEFTYQEAQDCDRTDFGSPKGSHGARRKAQSILRVPRASDRPGFARKRRNLEFARGSSWAF
jgi:hypothetical protein